MSLEDLAVALEQIADKLTDMENKGLKAGQARVWHDESGDVVLVLMDGGLVRSTVAGWRDQLLVADHQAGRTTDAAHQAHAAKLCRGAAAKLRSRAAVIQAHREATA